MSAPISLVQLREVVEPIINENFDSVYEQRRDEWKPIFTQQEGFKRSSHVETVLYGFGNAPITGDGEPLTYDIGGTLWSISYPYDQIALGFGITLMAMEDSEHIDIAQTFGRHLGQSMYETEEILAANIINNGFNSSYTQYGGDGQPLFSANHGMANGQVFSNIGTPAALSMSSLEQQLIQISLATDPMGKPIRLTPEMLVVPPALRFQAEVVLKSILNPDTPASNQINPVNSLQALGKGYQVITRLTSQTAWFISTDLNAKGDKGLVRFNRRNLTKGSQEDFNTNTVQNKASMRYRFGWVDPRGFYGNLGQ
jgi:hypothetical protein